MFDPLNSQIDRAWWEQKKIPLGSPYVLSFVTLEEITSLQVFIQCDGKTHSAEVVPLLGYSEESEEEIAAYLNKNLPNLEGLPLKEARSKIDSQTLLGSFARSPILTAIDLFFWHERLPPLSEDEVPLEFVKPATVTEPLKLLNLANQVVKKKAGTIKIKLSSNPKESLEAIQELEKQIVLPTTIRLRLDANQAYDIHQASILFSGLEKSALLKNIDYVEQPLPTHAWEENRVLREKFPIVEVMLDESLITTEHIKKAKELGVNFIKLKLFKQGGIEELYAQSAQASKWGLKVVLGNGVASWISNKIEIGLHMKYPHLFFGLSEANGFLKCRI